MNATQQSYTLKPNSIEGEYYCGDLPGNLQYSKEVSALLAMNTRDLPTGGADAQWSPEYCTATNRARLLPYTKNVDDWRLVLTMKKTLTGADGKTSIALKGALVNKSTGQVALMTTFSDKDAILSRGHRAIQSNADDWFIGHYRMGAPPIFWRTLQEVLAQ